jgi:hypothetical protein
MVSRGRTNDRDRQSAMELQSARLTSEVEDYQVNLDSVSSLELALRPDLTPENAFATWPRGAYHRAKRPVTRTFIQASIAAASESVLPLI